MYITYREYKTMGGKLDETAFNIYEFEAEQELNAATFGRINSADLSDRIKRCIIRLTDLTAQADISEDKISSFSNEGVSQSFVNVSQADYEKKVFEIINMYMADEKTADGTPILYRGVGNV